jgi:hypothetical protein
VKNFTVLLAALSLAACALPPGKPWEKSGAGMADRQEALADCEFKATAATQQTDPTLRTGLAAEIDRGMRKTDLMRLCMRSKGWS